MCVVRSFTWECVVLGLLSGKACCSVFYVAVCVVGYFRRQYELLYLLDGYLCCWFC